MSKLKYKKPAEIIHEEQLKWYLAGVFDHGHDIGTARIKDHTIWIESRSKATKKGLQELFGGEVTEHHWKATGPAMVCFLECMRFYCLTSRSKINTALNKILEKVEPQNIPATYAINKM